MCLLEFTFILSVDVLSKMNLFQTVYLMLPFSTCDGIYS